MRRAIILSVLLGVSWPTLASAAPKVVVSIVPLHGLASEVMAGVAEPQLLLKGSGSEHQASYSPEQIKIMTDADMVVIVGQGLELKLTELSGSEAMKGKAFFQMAGLPGLTTHPIRQGGTWEAGGHEHAGEGSEDRDQDEKTETKPAQFDPHLWLDPRNAQVFVIALAADMARRDPTHAKIYETNAATVVNELVSLEAELQRDLASVKAKPYIVFHDAFQYFEKRFDLAAAGSVADISATAPSAKRLMQVRQKVKAVNATCAFAEPQFSPKALATVTEGAGARTAILDPIGANITPGKGAYATLLRNLARNLMSCLGG